jgi:HD-GYP domain-containing protein (c-di-GMP phosphodiesterase class II)
LSEFVCDRLEIAGLLHDLGKLRVADDILDKPNELTYEEKLVMQRHSYDTYEILKKINGFDDIARWAALHHERLDGSGYPFRLTADQIPIEARIIAAADMFQGLAQNRPYRERLCPDSILSLMKEQVLQSLLDGDIVKKIADNVLHCWHLANPGERWQSVNNT